MRPIKPIRNDADHEAAIAEIAALWGAEPGTPESDRLDVLATLVDAYESRRWPMPKIDPVDALKAAMEAKGYTWRDLADVLGSTSRPTEILNRRRNLTLDAIRRISTAWNIPADLLIGDARVA